MHELIQSYFDVLYTPFQEDIRHSKASGANETYGDLLYYSALKLLKWLDPKPSDVFMDVGFGLGKLLFQVFLTTDVARVVGIEINECRFTIATQVAAELKHKLPKLFEHDRSIDLFCGDFLESSFPSVTMIYLCCTVFSFELLSAIGKKINTMNGVQKIASFRKLPQLTHFILIKKGFLHGSWDRTPCYLYVRKR